MVRVLGAFNNKLFAPKRKHLHFVVIVWTFFLSQLTEFSLDSRREREQP